MGDFSGAGAANIRQVSALPEGIANVQLGQFGYARALLADSPTVGPGTLLYAFEYNHYDGPWDLPESSNRYNGLLRYHSDHGRDSYNVTGSVYWAPFWHATDQVAGAAVDNGLIGRFGAIDPTDGGRRRGRRFRSTGPGMTATAHPAAALRLLLPAEPLVGLHVRPVLCDGCPLDLRSNRADRSPLRSGRRAETDLAARLVGGGG